MLLAASLSQGQTMNAHVPQSSLKGSLPGLLTPSAAYKPFRYPWAFDMWK